MIKSKTESSNNVIYLFHLDLICPHFASDAPNADMFVQLESQQHRCNCIRMKAQEDTNAHVHRQMDMKMCQNVLTAGITKAYNLIAHASKDASIFGTICFFQYTVYTTVIVRVPMRICRIFL